MKHSPYMPISVPDVIEVGPHKGRFAVRYRDEHGLQQTHFHFHTSQVAWAFAISQYLRHAKIPLIELPIGTLKEGDLILLDDYTLIQVTGEARKRDSLFHETYYAAKGVYAKELPRPSMELLIHNAYKLPLENEDFVI